LSEDPWLLKNSDGDIFGAHSYMSGYASAAGNKAWFTNCEVTPIIGGFEAMSQIRDAIHQTVQDANNSGVNFGGDRGHVYICDWRFNPNRDLSVNTTAPADPTFPALDTAWDLIRQLIGAGVRVRLLLWEPTTGPVDNFFAGFHEHQIAHESTVRLMRKTNKDTMKSKQLLDPNTQAPTVPNLGVAFLDSRVAGIHTDDATHHMKFIVIRGPKDDVAFCGGVDLAYTRRDAPLYAGDWQSGDNIPQDSQYLAESVIQNDTTKQPHDLPTDVYGQRQIWVDQHLKVRGNIVLALEAAFVERWCEPAYKVHTLQETGEPTTGTGTSKPPYDNNSVVSSSEYAFATVTHTTPPLGRRWGYFDTSEVIDKSDTYPVGTDPEKIEWENTFPPRARTCLLYTSPSPRDLSTSRMPASA